MFNLTNSAYGWMLSAAIQQEGEELARVQAERDAAEARLKAARAEEQARQEEAEKQAKKHAMGAEIAGLAEALRAVAARVLPRYDDIADRRMLVDLHTKSGRQERTFSHLELTRRLAPALVPPVMWIYDVLFTRGLSEFVSAFGNTSDPVAQILAIYALPTIIILAEMVLPAIMSPRERRWLEVIAPSVVTAAVTLTSMSYFGITSLDSLNFYNSSITAALATMTWTLHLLLIRSAEKLYEAFAFALHLVERWHWRRLRRKLPGLLREVYEPYERLTRACTAYRNAFGEWPQLDIPGHIDVMVNEYLGRGGIEKAASSPAGAEGYVPPYDPGGDGKAGPGTPGISANENA